MSTTPVCMVIGNNEDKARAKYDQLHKLLVKLKVLYADETTLQFLHEEGKKTRSKSYMWLYRTGGDAEHPFVLYEYKPDKKAENAVKFLDGFSVWLHADGYQGYHRLPENISVVGCWAHARRKFDEAVNSLPKPEQCGSAALEGQQYCTKPFVMGRKNFLFANTPIGAQGSVTIFSLIETAKEMTLTRSAIWPGC